MHVSSNELIFRSELISFIFLIKLLFVPLNPDSFLITNLFFLINSPYTIEGQIYLKIF